MTEAESSMIEKELERAAFDYDDDGEAVTYPAGDPVPALAPAHTVEIRFGENVRTCDVLDGVVISYGRQRVTDRTDPAHAALVIAGALQATLGDQVEVDVITAGAGRVRRFTGTITDLDVVLDGGADVSQTRVVAVSTGLGAMARRKIGDEPWPTEPAGTRIARHLAAAGVPAGVVDQDVVDVIAEDRDRAEALDLAQTTAGDALGILVDDRAGTVSYHAAGRRAVTSPTVILDACETELGAQSFQRVGDLVNRALISYGPEDTRGEEFAEDPESVARYGGYDQTRSTTLADAVDARTIARRAVALYAWPAWTMPQWSIPLHLLDPARADEIAALEVSDRVRLTSLPAPLPDTLAGFVEGAGETLTYYTRDLDLYLSDVRLSFPVQRWTTIPPATAWQDVSTPAPAWQDLWTETL